MLSELLIQSEIAGDAQLASQIKQWSLVDIKEIIKSLLMSFKESKDTQNPYFIRDEKVNQDKPVLSG